LSEDRWVPRPDVSAEAVFNLAVGTDRAEAFAQGSDDTDDRRPTPALFKKPWSGALRRQAATCLDKYGIRTLTL
jgi:hypothetical protein